MKDIVVSEKTIKTEVKLWVGSLIVAFLINVLAIILYASNWIEVFTQFHIVLILSIVIYVLLGLGRILKRGIKIFMRK